MKILLTVVAVVALLVAGALVAAWTGLVAVAATGPQSGVVEWYLHTARERSVARRAGAIEVPPLDDPRLLRTGLVEYQEMCVACHGAPGVRQSSLARGLNPMPPDLARPGDLHEGSTARTFWIVKNGLRMTGMPAFGPTHDDEELWAVTAFVERLPELSPEDYAAMLRNAGLTGAGGDHGDDHHHGAAGEGAEAGGEVEGAAPGDDHPHPAGTPDEHSHGGGPVGG
jgi:mono/diheme cytochrome c family protein